MDFVEFPHNKPTRPAPLTPGEQELKRLLLAYIAKKEAMGLSVPDDLDQSQSQPKQSE